MVDLGEAERNAKRGVSIFDDVDLKQLKEDIAASVAANRQLFAEIETFTMFLGNPRSGHSLLGGLLDAHPDMLVAHELNLLWFLDQGFRRDEIFQLLIENSKAFAAFGRKWEEYAYGVPGQWQGRWRQLRVIGDKKGGETTQLIQEDAARLDRLLSTFGAPKFIHVIRNPFDNIATISKKTGLPLDSTIERYFRRCETVDTIRARVGADRVLDVAYNDLVLQPRAQLERICGYLGVSLPEDYFAACAALLAPTPRQSRRGIEWPSASIQRVDAAMKRFAFLRDYSFET